MKTEEIFKRHKVHVTTVMRWIGHRIAATL